MPASRRKTLILRHVRYIGLVTVLWLCYWLSGIGCPVYRLLRLRCPTCGMSRALVALLTGDLALYADMQPFALPMLLAVIAGVHLPVMSRKIKRCSTLFLCITVAANFCWYIISLV